MSALHGANRDAKGALSVRQAQTAMTLKRGVLYTSSDDLHVTLVPTTIPAGAKVMRGVLLAPDGTVYVTTAAPQSIENGIGYRTNRALCVSFDAPANTAIQAYLPLVGMVLVSAAGYVHVGGASVILDWSNSEELLGAPAGIATTFTRATTAIYTGSDGLPATASSGAKRFGYDPVTLAARGIQLEQQSANLCLQSEDFSTTWTAIGTPTRSAAAKTAGVVVLDLVGDDSAAALEGYTQNITFTADDVKAISIYFSKGTATSSAIRLRDTTAGANRLLAAITWSGATPTVTMTTGTLAAVEGPFGSSGVYRARMVTASVTAANTNALEIYPATDAALDVTATGNIYFGGAQAENTTTPSSYIPTTTAAVTRNRDLLTMTTLSPWYNDTEGTIATEAMWNQDTGAGQTLWEFSDTTSNELTRAQRATTNTSHNLLITDGGVVLVNMTAASAYTSGSYLKTACSYKLNDTNCSIAGGAVSNDNACTMPTVTQLNIGSRATGSATLNGWNGFIKKWAYYPSRLPNAEMQALAA